MITANDVMQLMLVAIKIYFICFAVNKVTEMDYPFSQILGNLVEYFWLRWFFKRTERVFLEPVDWLIENWIYLCYMLLIPAETILMFNLLDQWTKSEVATKSIGWFIGSPLVSACFLGIIQYYEQRAGQRSLKRH